jgi:hypothetical protein
LPGIPGRPGRTRRNGVALLLVLVTVVLAVTLAIAFLTGQGTSIGIARNVSNQASARFVAESGLAFVVAYIEQNDTWRTDLSHGTWVTDSPFASGTFTIVGEDGEDTDGDGVISNPAEGDGDLADDASDRVTLTVTGKVSGTTHIVRAVIRPTAALGDLLLVVAPGDLPDDTERQQFAAGEGWTVATIKQNATQAQFNDAVAAADVAYISSTVSAGTFGTKLANALIGVVSEQPDLTDEFEFSSTADSYTDDQIDIVDNSHEITSSFSTGLLTVATSAQPLATATGTLASGTTTLAERPLSSDATLLTLDALSRFGEETVQGTQVSQNADKVVAARMVLSEDGTVTRITAYIKGAPPKRARFAIYADSGGEPGALIVQGALFNPSNVWGWKSTAVPSTPLTAGPYWLAVHFEEIVQAWVYGGTGATRRKDSAFSGGPPDPWAASDETYSGSMSIYASYTTGDGGAPGRRVFMPWGDTGFDFSELTSDGLDLLAAALEWAGQPDGSGGAAASYSVRWIE